METDLSTRKLSEVLDSLNEAQLEAVTTTDGPVLVVAGPGSGKTRVLTARIAYLIAEGVADPWSILALTFTNKAAREMKERVEALVGDRARWITMGTFHAFCARILRQYGGEIGLDDRFVIYDTSDQSSVVKTAMKQLDINTKQFAPRSVQAAISSAKSKNIDPGTMIDASGSYWEEVVGRVYAVYQKELRRRNALDFDDLLLFGLQLLRQSDYALQKLRERYRYVLVDEYQDTNHLQYLIVRELTSEHRNLCVVGDPDQSIYGWRAADIRNILEFTDDFPEAAEIHLEENYRSTPEILGAADAVIRENAQRIKRELRAARQSGQKIIVREFLDDEFEARFIVEEISRLKRSEGYTGSDFAVLYRTNAQSRPIEEAFIRNGMAYQLIGGTRFYERREIKDVIALMRVVVNASDFAAFERVIEAFPIGQGIGGKTLAGLSDWARMSDVTFGEALDAVGSDYGPDISGRGRKLLTEVRAKLARLRELESSLPLTRFFDEALEDTGYTGLYAGGDPEMMERWSNVLQLRATMESFDVVEADSRLLLFLEEAALVSDADTVEDDPERVTLITLHAVKGLEFRAVFVTGVEDGLIPHQRSISEDPTQLEEERRLFYVGMTRAQDRLYITHARRRSRFGFSEYAMPSSFLTAIPEELIGDLPTRERGSQRRRIIEQAQPAPVAMNFSTGQRVFHNTFGDGVVQEVLDKQGDQELIVDFKRHGTKRLMASLANLQTD